MKTTLNLNDLLLARANARPRRPFVLELVTVRGLAPPIADISDREELQDVMNGT